MHIGLLNEFGQAIQKMQRDRLLASLLNEVETQSLRLGSVEIQLFPEPCRSNSAIALFEVVFSGTAEEIDLRRNAALEHLDRSFGDKMVFLSMGEQRIACLFSWQDRSFLTELQRLAAEVSTVSFSAGVGLPCPDLRGIYKSLGQAAAALNEKFYQGAGIYLYTPKKAAVSCADYPCSEEDAIIEHVCNEGDDALLGSLLDQLYSQLAVGRPTDHQGFYSASMRLVVKLENLILRKDISVHTLDLPLLQLTRCDTLSSLKEFTLRMIMDIIKFKELHKNQDCSLIELSIEFMTQHCRDVTLQSLAERVFVTPNYLSMLFKTRTGKTFIDTLTDIRIEKAKMMIEQTNLKNYEICASIGYQDPRYFSKLFKQKVGLTPSEYRDSVNRLPLPITFKINRLN